MRPSIIELREFYATPRGRMAARQIARALTVMQRAAPPAPNAVDTSLVSFGYAVPVLDGAPATAWHLMPQSQGYQAWPDPESHTGATRTQLCEEAQWPLPNDSVGAVLLMHAVEHSADPQALLAEAWRVLAPQGRLWLVVSNRRSLWAQADSTPFGRGQPYSARQLRDLLHASLFVPESWRRALFAPPAKSRLMLAAAPLCEALLPWLAPLSGGVILLRAVKQLQAPFGLANVSESQNNHDFTINLANALPTG